ncbi:MAG: site-specific integrase [Ignavibacteriaceae bacterium]|nr:site-specific integrase [Ignavibacteriaceae bacterium]
MFLSKRPNGYYYVFYETPSGKRNSVSTKSKNKRNALKFLSEFQKNLIVASENEVTIIDLKTFSFDYLKFSEKFHRPKTYYMLKIIFEQFKEHLGNPVLNEITTRDCEIFIYKKADVSQYTAQKYLAHLRAAFNKALTQGYIRENPLRKINNFKIPETLPKFFSEDEFQSLLKVVEDEDLKDLIIFAINTGLRQMELITLEWNQIDFTSRTLILNNRSNITKSKKVRNVPLNTSAFSVLEKRKIFAVSKKVFTYKGGIIIQDFISKKFKKLVIKAKINTDFNFHSLRHTFASWLVQKGVSIYEVSKLLGHSDIKTTQIYAHLRSDDLRNAVEMLD